MKKLKIFLSACIIIAIAGFYIYFHFFASLQFKYLTKEQKDMVKNTSYSSQISNLETQKGKLSIEYKNAKKKDKVAIINKARKLFIEQISNHLFPYWYGTKWAFSGTSQIPQRGKIACGYFVTTTLEDVGYSLNRSSLACMASEQMINNLTQKKYITHISNTDILTFKNKISILGKGLYIVGLDKHTGFILYDENGIFFIHSGGQYPCHVRKENIVDSKTLINSKYKVVGKISDDDSFIINWLTNTND